MKKAVVLLLVVALAGSATYGLARVGVIRIPGITPGQPAATAAQQASPPPVEEPPLVEEPPTASAPHTSGQPLASADSAWPPTPPSPAPQRARQPAAAPSPEDRAEQERRLLRLASVYDQMPVDEASKVFERLPDPLVEQLLLKMDERQVARLLAKLPPDRAALLTRSLAR
ncbi:MAG TPA: hypothetical protein VLH79_08990 [Chthonomonadales bacterium]|nr:hypothetical protein [Chthonomonadales bacterium]